MTSQILKPLAKLTGSHTRDLVMEESNLAMFNHEIGKEKTDVINVYLQIRIYLILFISFVCKKVDNNGDNLHNSGTLMI